MKRAPIASLLAATLLAGAATTVHADNGQGAGTYSPHASCVGWGASQTAHLYPGAVPDALASTGVPVHDFVAYLHSLGPNCGLLG